MPIGAVTLAIGYGSAAVTTGGVNTVGAVTSDTTATTTEMGAEMSMSF
jgi:hypothetical protein